MSHLSLARGSHNERALSRRHSRLRSSVLILAMVAVALLILVNPGTALAQDADANQPQGVEYTIVPGDTLFEIAGRFGISLEELVAANNIADVNLIEPGQVLAIPAPTSVPSGAATNASLIHALPGDTLASIALRLQQDIEVLEALNVLSDTAELFPGQPVRVVGVGAEAQSQEFGAITGAVFDGSLVQGQTGNFVVTTRRPLAIEADWNGLPISFTPYDADPLRQFAYLPVPALLASGPYSLTISYVSGDGVKLTRVWPVQVQEGDYEVAVIDIPPERQSLLEPELVQNELERLAQTWSEVSPTLLWSRTFTRPIESEYETTSPFGTRRSYSGGPVASYHAGQDFGAPEGITVTAPADAIVALTQPLDVRGNAILLDHGRGVFTGYWHLSESFVEEGQAVAAGEPIGLVGNTGLSTGAHLHWELRIYGIAVDPMQFLEQPLLP